MQKIMNAKTFVAVTHIHTQGIYKTSIQKGLEFNSKFNSDNLNINKTKNYKNYR